MLLHIAFLVALSATSLGCVWAILRAADRRCFPATYLPMRAPEVLVTAFDYSPLDHRGLV